MLHNEHYVAQTYHYNLMTGRQKNYSLGDINVEKYTAYSRLAVNTPICLLIKLPAADICDSIVKTILLYGAETWPMLQANCKRLEAAHHRCLRRILNISWQDKVRNERVRELTRQDQL